jgi:hypothetical protein
MSISLEELLKTGSNASQQMLGTSPVAKMDTMQYIDSFLTKVVRIMELGNSMITNGLKIKDSVGNITGTKSPAIQQMEQKILETKALGESNVK